MSERASTVELTLGLDDPEDELSLRELAAKKLGSDVLHARIERRSLDARGGRVRLRLVVALDERPDRVLGAPLPRECAGPRDVVIVGSGPAGLFCAYELARAGMPSTVLDRGKLVQPRRHDLAALNQRGEVDADSNYCFGEGGAGTYSDGKLYTRATKRGSTRDVVETLAAHGAPETILVDARPHVGSNKLPKVVTAMRERLESVGVAFEFQARVTGIDVERSSDGPRVTGVTLVDGRAIAARYVVLATGHSARDALAMCAHLGVALTPKPFAMGVRVEHPQSLVNDAQYGRSAGHPRLPAAHYRLATDIDERGVYSFCMCPGGFVVPAATEPDGVVVNGMSLSKRDSPFACAGIVVSVTPEDIARAGFAGAEGGIDAQRALERAAFAAGGGALRAPAARVADFVSGRGSTTLPESSYQPGLAAADLAEVLDASGLALQSRLRQALGRFDRTLRGFTSSEAVLIGVETRTSSPVRIERDRDSLETREVRGLYPAGEGAGYAGGIASAALDGIRIAHAIARARALRGGTAPA